MSVKRTYGLAFLFGVCATLTLPPIYAFVLVIPAYGGLYTLLMRAEDKSQAVRIGFFWGWGFYITGLYWFVIALMTDPEKFAWLIPFALFALTAVIALYTAVFSYLYFAAVCWLFPSHCKGEGQDEGHVSSCVDAPVLTPTPALPLVGGGSFKKALLFAGLWTLIEFARGHLFTGFPWNLGGYVFAASDASIQLASLVGIYGLTFIAVLVGVLSVMDRMRALKVWLCVALAVGWGAWRAFTSPQEFAENIQLRLVQANIAQQHKWDPARQMQGLREHIHLMQSPGIENITHVIWPETAVPYVLVDNSTLATRLGETLLPGQHLITGIMRGEGDRITNAIAVVSAEGKVVGAYDKHKLVPFGEFLPLRWLIPDFLETPVGMNDMASGEGVKTLTWPGLPPVSPLICYEVIFPGQAVRADDRPDWLLSVTNDAWFGTSSAPYQHLAMARMRAVEQGLPMVRAANTGISAIFDAYGREISRIPLNQQGFMDSDLPMPTTSPTLYSRLITF